MQDEEKTFLNLMFYSLFPCKVV